VVAGQVRERELEQEREPEVWGEWVEKGSEREWELVSEGMGLEGTDTARRTEQEETVARTPLRARRGSW
jgi:hypothetical protein